MGYIYCFKNLINNKVYIGKTVNDPQKRYYQHLHKHINDGTVFHNALKKYGYKEFMFYVIGEFPDNKLNYYENFYIKQFNSHWRDGWGYNMSYGGENSPDILEKRVRAYPLNENLEPIKEKGIIFKS
jgi:group I intron endonuclease